MADDGLTIAIIPARGGSKSIPRKNIAPLGGRPLLAWSIDVARRVRAIDRVIVSTDDEEIADVALRYGADVIPRPPHLATDDSLVIETLRDVIRELTDGGQKVRIVVLLEPTCPFRSPADVETCLLRMTDEDVDSVATFTPAAVNPLRTWRIRDGHPETFMPDVNPWLPRQQLPAAYQLNGAVYAFRATEFHSEHQSILFGNTAAVVMPIERSVDVDGPLDLQFAEMMLGGVART